MLLFVFLAASIAWHIARSTTFQLFGDLIARVETETPVIALTFDDGPSPKYLQSVLETLREGSVPATFFLVGRDVVKHPELVRDIADAGHEIGNHSFTHPRMLLMRSRTIAQEIENTDSALRDAGYKGPIQFRPPYGKKLIALPLYLRSQGRPSIMWDIAPEKWSGTIEQRVDQIAQDIKPGSIILLHVMYESGDGARRFLPLMINRLKSDGFEFVTLTSLLDQ